MFLLAVNSLSTVCAQCGQGHRLASDCGRVRLLLCPGRLRCRKRMLSRTGGSACPSYVIAGTAWVVWKVVAFVRIIGEGIAFDEMRKTTCSS